MDRAALADHLRNPPPELAWAQVAVAAMGIVALEALQHGLVSAIHVVVPLGAVGAALTVLLFGGRRGVVAAVAGSTAGSTLLNLGAFLSFRHRLVLQGTTAPLAWPTLVLAVVATVLESLVLAALVYLPLAWLHRRYRRDPRDPAVEAAGLASILGVAILVVAGLWLRTSPSAPLGFPGFPEPVLQPALALELAVVLVLVGAVLLAPTLARRPSGWRRFVALGGIVLASFLLGDAPVQLMTVQRNLAAGPSMGYLWYGFGNSLLREAAVDLIVAALAALVATHLLPPAAEPEPPEPSPAPAAS